MIFTEDRTARGTPWSSFQARLSLAATALLESWIKFRTSGFRIKSYDSLWGNPVFGSVFRTWFSSSMLQMWLKKIKYPQQISVWIKSLTNSKTYINLKIYCLCHRNSNCMSIYLLLQLLTVLLITVVLTTVKVKVVYGTRLNQGHVLLHYARVRARIIVTSCWEQIESES